jgi:hypothetical protein
MGTAPRSINFIFKRKRVREVKVTAKETPGPGQYTKVALINKLKAPTWV